MRDPVFQTSNGRQAHNAGPCHAPGGVAMSKLALLLALPAVLLAALAVLAGAPPASAAVIHDFLPGLSAKLSVGVPAEGPSKEPVAFPGLLGEVNALTVDEGHLWVAEQFQSHVGGEVHYRTDEFDASTGAFISQLPQVAGVTSAHLGVAVAHQAGKGQVYVGAVSSEPGAAGRVVVFSEAGALLATWTGASTPAEGFGQDGVGGVAVDNSTNPLTDPAAGDVYVADRVHHVVDVFKPEAGGVEPPKGEAVSQLRGTCPSPGTCVEGEVIPFSDPQSVAVDQSTGEVLVLDTAGLVSVVDVFKPELLGAYAFVRTITGPHPGESFGAASLAVDGGNGDIYVSDTNARVVDQFNAAGEYVGRLTGPAGGFLGSQSVAVDPVSHDVFVGDSSPETESGTVDAFGPGVLIPDVAVVEPVSSLTPTSATLHGTVNPAKGGEASCEFEYGTSTSYGQHALCSPEHVADGEVPVAVQSLSVTGLLPDTTYHYRLDATNDGGVHTNKGQGPEDLGTFTTTGPGIESESVSNVAGTSATLEATVNPDGASTSYYFEYATGVLAGCGANACVPLAPGEALGSGTEGVAVKPQHLQGLTPGTLYHYRVVAVSEVEGKPVESAGLDQTFTTQTAGAPGLPDGRRWEMVSPPDKHGALIQTIGEARVTQAAAGGNAVSYLADAPTEAGPLGYSNLVQVLSARGADGWVSRDIATAHATSTGLAVDGQEYRFFSEDLSLGVVHPLGGFTASLAPLEASEQTAYLRSNFVAGDMSRLCVTGCYRPLVTGRAPFANVPPGTVFGGEVPGEPGSIVSPMLGPEFAGAAPDGSHVVVRSPAQLTPTLDSHVGLYEWAAGQLQLVSVLPGGEPATGKPVLGQNNPGNKSARVARHAVSNDGSRLFFSISEGHLYMRDMTKHRTIQLDSGTGAGPVTPEFQFASSDGSRVFFTDQQRLTGDSGGGGLENAEDLYECEVIETAGELECPLVDLTPFNGKERALVRGEVLGASEDGSYVYYVANGIQAPGATHGECEGEPPPPEATCNLYMAHHDNTGWKTRLVAVPSAKDSSDWSGVVFGLSRMTSRVSPDGRWLAFMSRRNLTGYDTRDAQSGKPDEEVYLYDAQAGKLVCASCNPTGARPVGIEYGKMSDQGTIGGDALWEGKSHQGLAGSVPTWTSYNDGQDQHQPRYLGDSGRLFFNSPDALVPQDVNGTGDVYQYEPAGVGDCTSASATFSGRSGGCVGLISSGTASEEAGFLDASETGGDVFFFTVAKLSPQDTDTSRDVYDAHECSPAAPCLPPSATLPPPCSTEASCKAAPSPQPQIFGAPASATFSGPGNLQPEPPKPPAKPTAAEIRAKHLTAALASCRKKYKHAKKKRTACERAAHKRYPAAKKARK
jgi:hypothetical protein